MDGGDRQAIVMDIDMGTEEAITADTEEDTMPAAGLVIGRDIVQEVEIAGICIATDLKA